MRDEHRRASWLADVVLGGQDGLVNVLGVVLGVAAAAGSTRVVLAAGLASAIAGSISMAAVAYTSRLASRDVFASERAREYRHIVAIPDTERAEIREIYVRKGFSGELLDRIVETITGNRDVWVAEMMAEELRLVDVDRRTSVRAAVIVGVSSLAGSVVPLGAFLVLHGSTATIASVASSAAVLFAFGAYKGSATIGRPLRSGFQLALIGMTSALIAYLVGALFQT